MARKDFIVGKNIVADNIPSTTETSITTNSATTIASFDKTTADNVEFTVKVVQGDRRLSTKALALHNGTTVDLAQYGEISIAGEQYNTSASVFGTTWTTATQNVLNTFYGSYGVHYANNLWAIGGFYGEIITSTDATTWVTRTLTMPNSISAINFADGKWVAGNSDGETSISTDAITWVTGGQSIGNTIKTIEYGAGTWVVAGYNGRLCTSTDAITWTTRTSNFGSTYITSVAYGNGLWCAVGYSGQIRTSTDAITWVTRTSNFASALQIYSVAFGNNNWVAVGANGNVRQSTDAITWVTRVTNGGIAGTTKILNVQTNQNNGIWLASGYTGLLLRSTDSLTWTSVSSGVSSDLLALGLSDYAAIATAGFSTPLTSFSPTTPVEIPATFSADISGSEVRLRATITDAATTSASATVLTTKI